MRHLEKDSPIWHRVALLTTLIVGCLTYGEVDVARSLCKYTMPFSFNIQSSAKNRPLSWFEDNLNFLYLLRVPACLEFPMV